jgi:acetyl-CoA carboxylase biotin carboxyl carrier protein
VSSGEARDRQRPLADKLRGEQMEVRDIKGLLVLMRDYGLVELEIEDKKGKVRLVRGKVREVEDDEGAVRLTARAESPLRSSPPVKHVPAKTEDATSADGIELGPNQKLIESPMVGMFYRSPSPETPPFVEEGSSVRKGQPLCIIEAMKMMNEIEAPAAGRIVRIIATNAQPIEYGQPLMILEVA